MNKRIPFLLTLIFWHAPAAPVDSFCSLTNHIQAQAVLGYDPAIEYFPGTENRSLTLYFHGWNRDKNDVKTKLYFQMPAILFNFSDASPTRQARLCDLSLGQIDDIRPALFILHAAAVSGLTDTMNLVGYSRGAATIVNLIGVLNNPASYQNELATVGITEPIRITLLQMIQHGTILLDCPLKYPFDSIFKYLQRHRSQIIPTPITQSDESVVTRCLKSLARNALFCSDYLCALVMYTFYLPLYSNYKPWGEEVFSSLDHWHGLHLTTIIRYDNGDPVVGNAGDEIFFEKIHTLNPETTHLIVSDHTGHCSPFLPLVELFNKLSS